MEFLLAVNHLSVFLVVFTKVTSGTIHPPVTGIHDRPFAVVWADHTKGYDRCRVNFGIHLDYTAYGIVGGVDNSVIFCNDAMGLYPFVKNGVVFNGGLPQLVILTSHLEKAATDIMTKIPDVHYSGVAVVDWEYWQPVWEANPQGSSREIYRNMSISLVQSRYPDWEKTLVEDVARLQFEQAAQSLFESTILLARQLRPNALWGFYHFPYCDVRNSTENCTQVLVQAGDQMQWLYERVATLYPSIYLTRNMFQDSVLFVKAVLGEAFRVRKNSHNHYTPVFSFCRYKYERTELFLTKERLRDTILMSAETGVSGVVMWVSNNDTRHKKSCLELRQYIHTALGPLVKTTIDAALRCSQSLCSGHGRCVGKILTCTKTAPSFELEDSGDGERTPSASETTRRRRLEVTYPSWLATPALQSIAFAVVTTDGKGRNVTRKVECKKNKNNARETSVSNTSCKVWTIVLVIG